jgi:hypothetical protein
VSVVPDEGFDDIGLVLDASDQDELELTHTGSPCESDRLFLKAGHQQTLSFSPPDRNG